MRQGPKNRGPVNGIAGIGPIEAPDMVSRIRAMERIAATSRYQPSSPMQRTFQEVLESWDGSPARVPVRSNQPLPQRKPLPPLVDDEELERMDDEPPQGSFLARVFRTIKAR
jgi:hypothetical protein